MSKAKNPHAVALGRLGGKKSRGWVHKLPPDERRRIMRELEAKRWPRRLASD